MNELAPINQMPLQEMEHVSQAIASSGLFGITKPQQALVLMMLCQSEGKNPIQAVKTYHIINGKPSMRADAMLAEFQRQGGTVQWGERSNARVSGTFSHPAGGSLEVTWTMKDAEAAQLLGNPTWKKFPRQMLTARVISEAIRTILPGVVAGIYTPEEVADMGVIEGEVVQRTPPDPAPISPRNHPRQLAPKAPKTEPAPLAPPDPDKAVAIQAFIDAAGRHSLDVSETLTRRALLTAILWPGGNAPQRVATTDEWKAATQLLIDNGIPKAFALAPAEPMPPAAPMPPAPDPVPPATEDPLSEPDISDLDDPFKD